MEKTKIPPDAPAGQVLHAHLEPVIDFLLLEGNRLTHSYRWGSNREGYFCHVRDPIDFVSLVNRFEFPESVLLVVERDTIYCRNTGCVIQTVP